MKNYSYMTQGTCARQITFSLEDGKLHDVHFVGGCPGNTLASQQVVGRYRCRPGRKAPERESLR